MWSESGLDSSSAMISLRKILTLAREHRQAPQGVGAEHARVGLALTLDFYSFYHAFYLKTSLKELNGKKR